MSSWLEEQLLEEGEREAISRELRLLWLYWAGCFGMMPVLVVIAEVFAGQLRENMKLREDLPVGVLTAVLFIVGILSLGLSYFLRRRFLAGKMKGLEKMAEQMAGGQPAYLVKYRGGIYLPMAMASCVGMYGFALYILGAERMTFYVFIVLGALGCLYHRPRREELIELMKKEKEEKK